MTDAEGLTVDHALPLRVRSDLRWSNMRFHAVDLYAMLFDGDRTNYLAWA